MTTSSAVAGPVASAAIGSPPFLPGTGGGESVDGRAVDDGRAVTGAFAVWEGDVCEDRGRDPGTARSRTFGLNPALLGAPSLEAPLPDRCFGEPSRSRLPSRGAGSCPRELSAGFAEISLAMAYMLAFGQSSPLKIPQSGIPLYAILPFRTPAAATTRCRGPVLAGGRGAAASDRVVRASGGGARFEVRS